MATEIKAIVFDFDGTIIDSESSIIQAYTDLYAEHGQQFPLELWMGNVGTGDTWLPEQVLSDLLGGSLSAKEIYEEAERRNLDILNQADLLPGVRERIAEAKSLGLKLGCASSSPTRWLNYHLPRLGLLFDFEVVRGCTDVDDRRKPDPAVYLSACEGLNVDPTQAIALEDTKSGVTAAKGAGMFAVAIPNQVTKVMDFSLADFVVNGLDQITIAEIIRRLG